MLPFLGASRATPMAPAAGPGFRIAGASPQPTIAASGAIATKRINALKLRAGVKSCYLTVTLMEAAIAGP